MMLFSEDLMEADMVRETFFVIFNVQTSIRDLCNISLFNLQPCLILNSFKAMLFQVLFGRCILVAWLCFIFNNLVDLLLLTLRRSLSVALDFLVIMCLNFVLHRSEV